MSGSVGDNTARASGVIASAGGGGKIGQVINVIKTDTASRGGASWADISGMTATITPSATDSKILWGFYIGESYSSGYGKIQIVYGDDSALTTAAIGDTRGSRVRCTAGGMYDASTDTGQQVSVQGLDAPNTISATTYKLQWWTSGTFYLNRRGNDTDNASFDSAISTLTLMEVLA